MISENEQEKQYGSIWILAVFVKRKLNKTLPKRCEWLEEVLKPANNLMSVIE